MLEALLGGWVDHQPDPIAPLGTRCATQIGFEARNPLPSHNDSRIACSPKGSLQISWPDHEFVLACKGALYEGRGEHHRET
jgi:hypothetical protein